MTDAELNRGVFVFSWDFELAWGFHDLPNLPDHLVEYDSRAYINELIEILEEFDIPSTWATVGHLLLSECDTEPGRPHRELPVPTENWYDSDPCTNVNEDPLWYAPDVIDRLRSCQSSQEIASHTFSHITTDVGSEILEAELAACREVSEEGEMRTFVSPRHGEIPSTTLYGADYESYRAPSDEPTLGQAVEFYTDVGGPPTTIPNRDACGLWRHPSSTFFFYNPLHPLQRRIPSIKQRWFERGLQRAIEEEEVFHVWAHPHNFIGKESSVEQFRWLMERVAAEREAGRIDTMTMTDLTRHASLAW